MGIRSPDRAATFLKPAATFPNPAATKRKKEKKEEKKRGKKERKRRKKRSEKEKKGEREEKKEGLNVAFSLLSLDGDYSFCSFSVAGAFSTLVDA